MRKARRRKGRTATKTNGHAVLPEAPVVDDLDGDAGVEQLELARLFGIDVLPPTGATWVDGGTPADGWWTAPERKRWKWLDEAIRVTENPITADEREERLATMGGLARAQKARLAAMLDYRMRTEAETSQAGKAAALAAEAKSK